MINLINIVGIMILISSGYTFKKLMDIEQEVKEIKNGTLEIFKNTDPTPKVFEPWMKK